MPISNEILYRFRRSESVYSVYISREHRNSVSIYGCDVSVSVIFSGRTGFFTFEKRENLLLNGKEPEHAADIMMKRLGDSLYPITFEVSKMGNIIGLKNAEDIRSRWLAQSEQLLRDMNHSPAVERYVSASWLNVKDDRKLQSAILRDSFIKLYFATYGEEIDLVIYNFPEPGNSSNFKLQMSDRYENNIFLTDTKERNTIAYGRSASGELLHIKAILETTYNEELCRLDIEIQKIPDNREVR